jgi:hypothetical protein
MDEQASSCGDKTRRFQSNDSLESGGLHVVVVVVVVLVFRSPGSPPLTTTYLTPLKCPNR